MQIDENVVYQTTNEDATRVIEKDGQGSCKSGETRRDETRRNETKRNEMKRNATTGPDEGQCQVLEIPRNG